MFNSRLHPVITCFGCLFVITPVAADEIDRVSSKTPLRGKIKAESRTDVTIEVSQGTKTETVTVGLDDIAEVRYEGPAGLAIRNAAALEAAGQFDRAAEAFEKAVAAAGDNPYITQAARFGQARSLAKLAQTDSNKVVEATEALKEFSKQFPNSRFHFPLQEILGNLFVEAGNDSAAAEAFRELATAPSNDLKRRAALAEGRRLLKAEKITEAQARFNEVAVAPAKTAQEKLQQQQALLAQGAILVQLKQADQAVQLFRQVIRDTAADEVELQAATWNALGEALREAGKPKEALIAHLEVDLVYCTNKIEHAKALFHIAQLWQKLGRATEAAASREKLQKLYPGSTWAKKLNQ